MKNTIKLSTLLIAYFQALLVACIGIGMFLAVDYLCVKVFYIANIYVLLGINCIVIVPLLTALVWFAVQVMKKQLQKKGI